MLTNVSGVSPDIGGPSGVLRGSDPKKESGDNLQAKQTLHCTD